jgi:hypothetical protein
MGCAVGGMSSQLVVPKASAEQAATLTNWEYKCQETAAEGATEMANLFGRQGWEMVGLGAYPNGEVIPCFKRPKM